MGTEPIVHFSLSQRRKGTLSTDWPELSSLSWGSFRPRAGMERPWPLAQWSASGRQEGLSMCPFAPPPSSLLPSCWVHTHALRGIIRQLWGTNPGGTQSTHFLSKGLTSDSGGLQLGNISVAFPWLEASRYFHTCFGQCYQPRLGLYS